MLSFIAIYFFSADHRKEDFYNRLENKALNTAKLLIEVEEVDVNLLRRIDKDNPMNLSREKITVFDQNDSIIYTTDDDQLLNVDPSMLREIREEGSLRYIRDEHEVLGLSYTDAREEITILIAATDIYGLRKLSNLINILFFVALFSLVVLLILGWIFSGRALKPISKVISQVDEISIASIDLRVDEGNGQDEIARLAQTFNKMLDRLETAFQMQKNFIANASHELRTPLTAISGQLEVLLLKKRSVAEYEQVVSSVLEDMKNLNQISNRLLLIAHATAEGRDSTFTLIRVDDILWQAKEELLKRNKDYNIQVFIDPSIDEDRKLIIRGDEQLTKSAILNLMENGCKFSPDKQVVVEVQHLQKNLMIRFADSGIGIPPLEIEKIFEPFHRAGNAHHIKGHGIGLSLVDKVVRLQQGTIAVTSKVNQGSVFTMTFPTAT